MGSALNQPVEYPASPASFSKVRFPLARRVHCLEGKHVLFQGCIGVFQAIELALFLQQMEHPSVA